MSVEASFALFWLDKNNFECKSSRPNTNKIAFAFPLNWQMWGSSKLVLRQGLWTAAQLRTALLSCKERRQSRCVLQSLPKMDFCKLLDIINYIFASSDACFIKSRCHAGPCPPCLVKTTETCYCGATQAWRDWSDQNIPFIMIRAMIVNDTADIALLMLWDVGSTGLNKQFFNHKLKSYLTVFSSHKPLESCRKRDFAATPPSPAGSSKCH